MPARRPAGRFAAIAFALAAPLTLRAQNATHDPHACDPGCAKARAALAAERAAGPAAPEDPVGVAAIRESFDDTDVLHYNLDIEVFPDDGLIAGTNVITVRSLVDGLTEFTFRLYFGFGVSSAKVNGTPVTLTTIGTTTRRATLDRAYNAGEQFDLTIVYDGQPASGGFGSFRFGGDPNDPHIHTLSEPYYAYTWWPCKDGERYAPGDNLDKATLEFAITVPDPLRAVSNGTLIATEPLPGDRTRYRWTSDYPIATYLVAFSAAAYNTWTLDYVHENGVMPVEFNIYPGSDTPANRNAWGRCVPMLGIFKDLFGPYPFIEEKYGIYQFDFGGGMEHQTNTGQGTFSETVTAHELGHQWWGDMITCRTWHDIWLNEGFATYCQALWAEYHTGVSNKAALSAWMSANFPDGAGAGDSVYVYDTTSVGRIFSGTYSYRKGGWVLHQLRHHVGDETFFEILAAYRAAYAYSAATTDDFAAVAAGVAGEDLSWFFDQWVYYAGAPAYDVGWEVRIIDGQAYLRLAIDQHQISVLPFSVKLPFTVRDGAAVTDRPLVWNDDWTEHFVIPISSPAPTLLAFDEANWVLDQGATEVPYFDGPPVVVDSSIDPGAAFAHDEGPAQITLHFSEEVIVTDELVGVSGAAAGEVPFAFAYDAPNLRATLTFAGPLASDDYTLTVSDGVVSSVAGIALDGELSAPHKAFLLPTGDGRPGGDCVIAFRVAAPCPADLDGDLAVTLADLSIQLAHFGTVGGAQPEDGDVDGDGDVDLADLSVLLAVFGQPC